jgi:hypothetical protein
METAETDSVITLTITDPKMAATTTIMGLHYPTNLITFT